MGDSELPHATEKKNPNIQEYYALLHNEIATGFVIDFLESLHLDNVKTALEAVMTVGYSVDCDV